MTRPTPIRMPTQAKLILTGVIGLVLLVLLASFSPFTSVPTGNRAVTTLFGKVQSNVLDEGFHLVNPLVAVHSINVRTQIIAFDNSKSVGDDTEASSLFAATKDLQDVQIATIVTYHIPESLVKEVYQQYSGEESFQHNKLSPIIREGVKSLSAEYTAEELVTKRQEVSDKMQSLIATRFTELGAVFESFKIVNFEFSKEFTQAIERKATAVQDAETAKNKLEQVKYEADQRIAEARGEAEAIKIQAQAIQTQGGAEYVNLKKIEKWNGQGCASYCGLEAASGLLIQAR